MFIFKNEDGTIAVGNTNYDGLGVEVQSLPDEAEFLLWNDLDPTQPIVSAEAKSESLRVQAKTTRDADLQANTYTLTVATVDYVYQVRPQDLPNFDSVIKIGADQKWVLADNTTRLTTVTEMQTIMNSGVAQGKAIWDAYIATIEAL